MCWELKRLKDVNMAEYLFVGAAMVSEVVVYEVSEVVVYEIILILVCLELETESIVVRSWCVWSWKQPAL